MTFPTNFYQSPAIIGPSTNPWTLPMSTINSNVLAKNVCGQAMVLLARVIYSQYYVAAPPINAGYYLRLDVSYAHTVA